MEHIYIFSTTSVSPYFYLRCDFYCLSTYTHGLPPPFYSAFFTYHRSFYTPSCTVALPHTTTLIPHSVLLPYLPADFLPPPFLHASLVCHRSAITAYNAYLRIACYHASLHTIRTFPTATSSAHRFCSSLVWLHSYAHMPLPFVLLLLVPHFLPTVRTTFSLRLFCLHTVTCTVGFHLLRTACYTRLHALSPLPRTRHTCTPPLRMPPRRLHTATFSGLSAPVGSSLRTFCRLVAPTCLPVTHLCWLGSARSACAVYVLHTACALHHALPTPVPIRCYTCRHHRTVHAVPPPAPGSYMRACHFRFHCTAAFLGSVTSHLRARFAIRTAARFHAAFRNCHCRTDLLPAGFVSLLLLPAHLPLYLLLYSRTPARCLLVSALPAFATHTAACTALRLPHSCYAVFLYLRSFLRTTPPVVPFCLPRTPPHCRCVSHRPPPATHLRFSRFCLSPAWFHACVLPARRLRHRHCRHFLRTITCRFACRRFRCRTPACHYATHACATTCYTAFYCYYHFVGSGYVHRLPLRLPDSCRYHAATWDHHLSRRTCRTRLRTRAHRSVCVRLSCRWVLFCCYLFFTHARSGSDSVADAFLPFSFCLPANTRRASPPVAPPTAIAM